jgi:hypothetical protein
MAGEFAIAEVMPGKLNALVKNIMRQTGETDPNKAVRLINSGKWVLVPKSLHPSVLHEIRISVASDGTTGKQWIKRLEKKDLRVSDYAKQLLLSPDFKPTKGIIYNILVIKGAYWKNSNSDGATAKIRNEALERKLETPNVEVACLLLEELASADLEAMGLLWITVMHDPIASEEGENLLSVYRLDDGLWLDATSVNPTKGGIEMAASPLLPRKSSV